MATSGHDDYDEDAYREEVMKEVMESYLYGSEEVDEEIFIHPPTKGDKKHDTKLFCLTMLMSSALIYNMKGVIDQDALDRLSFITTVTKNVSVAGSNYANEDEDKNTLQIIAPHFVLCLRDFFYDLVDDGEMTADEYMESCLEESQNNQNDEYNNIRNSITTFFPKRKCFVMAQPAMNQKLKRIETLSEDELEKEFQRDVKSMVTFVHGLGPKRLDQVTGKLWDGNAFETFLRSYIKELSEGQKMEYGNAMEYAGRYHNSKLMVTICLEYQAKLNNVTLPMTNQLELLDLALFYMNESLHKFRQEAYPFLLDHFEDKARQKMETKMKDLAAENSRKVQKLCCEYLNTKHEKMVQENKKTYRRKNGMHRYEKDFNELLSKYNKTFKDYDDAERCEALQKFQESLKGQVMELKYQAKLQEEISRYEEELQKRDPFDMAAFMRRELEKIRKEQEQKFKEELDAYKKKMNELSPGNMGFFQRLKYLITGHMNTE